MPKRSTGLIMYRWRDAQLEVFLVHPGGPFWVKKNMGAWSIPKGESAEGEEPLEAAKREFREETGSAVSGEFLKLGEVKQAGGKVVIAWAVEGDFDPATLISNVVQLEWPPHSGRVMTFPEVDRGDWFGIAAAREYILKSQEPLLNMLCHALRITNTSSAGKSSKPA
jgi:predicted NUDIX family NTP pyrophosphohydrolase